MKKLLFAVPLLMLTSCYNRIGDLNMLSNRNIDSSKEYVVLQRNVEAVAKTRKKDALERAVDKATESVNGEYLMNVKVFVGNNGNKIKVIGDVWGYPENVPAPTTTEKKK